MADFADACAVNSPSLGCRFLLLQLSYFVAVCFSLHLIADLFVHVCPVFIGECEVGFEPDSLGVARNRLLVIPFQEISSTTAGMGRGVLGVSLDLLVEVGKRTIEIAFLRIGKTSIEISVLCLGIELESMVEVGDGAIVIVFGLVTYAASRVRFRAFRI